MDWQEDILELRGPYIQSFHDQGAHFTRNVIVNPFIHYCDHMVAKFNAYVNYKYVIQHRQDLP